MALNGASGIGSGVRATNFGDFDYTSLKAKDDDEKKFTRYGDPNVSGIFTAQQVAYSQTGSRSDGAYNA